MRARLFFETARRADRAVGARCRSRRRRSARPRSATAPPSCCTTTSGTRTTRSGTRGPPATRTCGSGSRCTCRKDSSWTRYVNYVISPSLTSERDAEASNPPPSPALRRPPGAGCSPPPRPARDRRRSLLLLLRRAHAPVTDALLLFRRRRGRRRRRRGRRRHERVRGAGAHAAVAPPSTARRGDRRPLRTAACHLRRRRPWCAAPAPRPPVSAAGTYGDASGTKGT